MLRCSSTVKICTTSLRAWVRRATYLELEPGQDHEQVLHQLVLVCLLCKLRDKLGHGLVAGLAIEDVLRLLDALVEVLADLAARLGSHRLAQVQRSVAELHDTEARDRLAHAARELMRRALLRLEQEIHKEPPRAAPLWPPLPRAMLRSASSVVGLALAVALRVAVSWGSEWGETLVARSELATAMDRIELRTLRDSPSARSVVFAQHAPGGPESGVGLAVRAPLAAALGRR